MGRTDNGARKAKEKEIEENAERPQRKEPKNRVWVWWWKNRRLVRPREFLPLSPPTPLSLVRSKRTHPDPLVCMLRNIISDFHIN